MNNLKILSPYSEVNGTEALNDRRTKQRTSRSINQFKYLSIFEVGFKILKL